MLTTVRSLALVATALYLVPTGAHLFELPHKMALAPADYMIVQRIYAGWALFGIVIAVAIAATAAQVALVRAVRSSLIRSGLALLALAATQAIFWMFTYPVNQATHFWTVVPQPFEPARLQWEASHALSAGLTILALLSLVIDAVRWRSPTENATAGHDTRPPQIP